MACILEYSDGYNRTAEVNWVAMQSLPSGAQIGTTSLDSWTTGTICKRIDFQQVSFVCKPVFFSRKISSQISVIIIVVFNHLIWCDDTNDSAKVFVKCRNFLH